MIPEHLTITAPWFAPQLHELLGRGDRLPHALLLHGPPGIGKRRLGRALARALLCETTDDALRLDGGCGACRACGWFDRGNHPDFRRVTSEAIAAAEGVAEPDDGDDEAGDAPAKSSKAPSRDVKIEQIRALQRFLAVGTHRGHARVVLLYPVEALNAIAANALLKMLEEPPPETIFVLVADHVGARAGDDRIALLQGAAARAAARRRGVVARRAGRARRRDGARAGRWRAVRRTRAVGRRRTRSRHSAR